MDEFYDCYPSLTPELVEPVLHWGNNRARKAMGLDLVA